MTQAELKARYCDKYQYELANQKTDDILRHSKGKNIEKLLFDKNPSEPDHIWEYRKKNMRQITRTYVDKIVNSISKITRSAEFVIAYPESGLRDAIIKFCEKELHEYGSVKNWFTSIGLKTLLTEPNGVFTVMWELGDNYENNPYPEIEIYKTAQIEAFDDEYVFIRSDRTTKFENSYTGFPVYLLFDKNYVFEFVAVNEIGEYQENVVYEHNLGYIPAWRFGGELFEDNVYESFIAGIVPFFDEAFCLQSDKQGMLKQAGYPIRWAYEDKPCVVCNGHGTVNNPKKEGTVITCKACNGTAYISSAYSAGIKISPAKRDQPNAPIPPAGIIEPSIAPLEYISKDIQQNLYSGLAAINFEFLASVPLQESGVAKQVDREELNGFLYKIAWHSVKNILEPIYLTLIRLNWKGTFKIETAIEDYLPVISVPEKFDIISAAEIEKEIANAKVAGVDPVFLESLQLQYNAQKFKHDDAARNYNEAAIRLNPLSSSTPDQIMAGFADGVISFEDYQLSANIGNLIRTAVAQNPNFYELDFMAQTDFLKTLLPKQNEIVSPLQNNG